MLCYVAIVFLAIALAPTGLMQVKARRQNSDKKKKQRNIRN